MFQSLRPSNQLFILSKGEHIVLERGSVVSVSVPVPKYQVPPMFGQPQEKVVDILVNVNGHDTNYQKIPADADIADFGNNSVVLSDNRDAMNAEVLSIKQKSSDIIASVGYHENVIKECDEILNALNPEYAERQAQQEEIDELKKQMCELMKINKEMMEQLKGSGLSSKNKKEQ